MIEVFADAFYYIALINPYDRAHPAALRLTRTLKKPLVTTTWIFLEVADALSSPNLRRQAHQALTLIATDPNTRLIPATEEWYA